jgi:hypothetical protein
MIKFREVLVIRELISSDPFVRLGHGRGLGPQDPVFLGRKHCGANTGGT